MRYVIAISLVTSFAVSLFHSCSGPVKIECKNSISYYTPNANKVDLKFVQDIPVADSSVIFCCAASSGDMGKVYQNCVSDGTVKCGIADTTFNGAFMWHNGQWKFYLFDWVDGSQIAQYEGGMLFSQVMLVFNGEKRTTSIKPPKGTFRALCNKNGELCVAQANLQISTLDEFIELLIDNGVTQALYLNYAGDGKEWYRDASYARCSISNLPQKTIPNMLVFYKY